MSFTSCISFPAWAFLTSSDFYQPGRLAVSPPWCPAQMPLFRSTFPTFFPRPPRGQPRPASAEFPRKAPHFQVSPWKPDDLLPWGLCSVFFCCCSLGRPVVCILPLGGVSWVGHRELGASSTQGRRSLCPNWTEAAGGAGAQQSRGAGPLPKPGSVTPKAAHVKRKTEIRKLKTEAPEMSHQKEKQN